MILSQETVDAILRLQKQYPQKRSALIPALHMAQIEKGYLPKNVQQEVADLFEIDLNEVNAVVTFYDMFTDVPSGKHHIHVCKNLSCMLRGSDELLDSLCQKLGIKAGETTSDGQYTVMPAECLGACDRAPFCIVDDVDAGPVKNPEELLEIAKKNKGHASPIYGSEVH